jgi:fibronectin type 3 domain-containing protein
VAGYNVYRGTQAGGPYSVITSGPDASTSYTDNAVQAGQTYYYVVTAVDGSGNESVNSNQVQAVIPTP